MTGTVENHYITVDGSRYRVPVHSSGKILGVIRIQEVAMNMDGPKGQRVLRALHERHGVFWARNRGLRS